MIQRFKVNGKTWLSANYSDWRAFQLSKITKEEKELKYMDSITGNAVDLANSTDVTKIRFESLSMCKILNKGK